MDIKMTDGRTSAAPQDDNAGFPLASSSTKTPSPSQAKVISSMNKRQQAAQKARMVALSKQLKTRLQYAAFKVEHGWSKQSLSEVENLYYKHRRASSSIPSPNAVQSGSIGISHYTPSTPTPQWRTKTSPTVIRKASIGSGLAADVFAGLVTPPASGGTFPGGYDRYKDLFSNHHSFASGLNTQKSPSLNARSGTQQSSNRSGKSYADFWSKIGTSNNATPASNVKPSS